MTASPKPQEPSMEEILASIRRIISDDQDAPKPPLPEPPALPASAPPEDDDVLDLAEIEAVAPPPPPRPAIVPLPEPRPREEPRVERKVEPPAPEPPQRPRELPLSADHLLSGATDTSVGNAFNMLAHTVLTNNARTLEDLVRELLKPMLKSWLDDNLPPLVERLVRAEIERVARGGR